MLSGSAIDSFSIDYSGSLKKSIFYSIFDDTREQKDVMLSNCIIEEPPFFFCIYFCIYF